MLHDPAILTIVAGALLGGFVSGLAGFGTGLVALGIWLYAVPPAEAAGLVALCSVVSQIQTIRTVWHAIDVRHLWPIVAAGLIGVPFGVAVLAIADPTWFRLGTGVLLLAFSGLLLASRRRPTVERGGRAADVAVGLAGGVLGGLAGLSGPVPIMWATVRGWTRDRRRALFQVYNLTILLASLIGQAASGLLTRDFLALVPVALPGTLAGAWLGVRVYRRLSDDRFETVILLLLALSGISLLLSAR